MLPELFTQFLSQDFEEATLATTNNEYHDNTEMVDELSSIYLK